MKSVTERLADLRAAMAEMGADACILPSSDPHASEYAPAHYTAWEYFSGFTCENSHLAVTAEAAAMWVDGRFFGAADAALAGTGIESMHMGEKGVPTPEEWLSSRLNKDQTLAYDPRMFTIRRFRELKADLESSGICLKPLAPAEAAWTEDRPALPATKAWLLAPEFAGRTAAEKLADYRSAITELGCDAGLITRLDCTAWLLNLRADDVANTPYAIAFCYVDQDQAVLFTDGSRVPAEAAAALKADGVTIQPYEAVESWLKEIEKPSAVLLDPGCTNAALYNALEANEQCTVLESDDPILMMKAVKNTGELAGTRAAHLRDGAAMVRFQIELERRLAAGETLRETDIHPILLKYRSMGENFLEASFNTIAAYGPNAAQMHYAPKPGRDAQIQPKGFLLVDCGGTYYDGTTDITRTYAVGPLTEKEKQMYTLTLRSHIDIAMAVWKEKMTGGQLDMLARQPFWSRMLDYRCGTGHSVCHVGAVHEGPHSLRWSNTVEFVPGMIVTDEPGYYEEGAVGVRVENELVCVEAGESEYGRFLKFEPIMYAPIDTTPVLPEEMTREELNWLNAYHAEVLAKLSPLLTEEEQAWLAEKCRPVSC